MSASKDITEPWTNQIIDIAWVATFFIDKYPRAIGLHRSSYAASSHMHKMMLHCKRCHASIHKKLKIVIDGEVSTLYPPLSRSFLLIKNEDPSIAVLIPLIVLNHRTANIIIFGVRLTWTSLMECD